MVVDGYPAGRLGLFTKCDAQVESRAATGCSTRRSALPPLFMLPVKSMLNPAHLESDVVRRLCGRAASSFHFLWCGFFYPFSKSSLAWHKSRCLNRSVFHCCRGSQGPAGRNEKAQQRWRRSVLCGKLLHFAEIDPLKKWMIQQFLLPLLVLVAGIKRRSAR